MIKTVRLTSFQNPQLQSVLTFFYRVKQYQLTALRYTYQLRGIFYRVPIQTSFCICICNWLCTFLYCFERLFLCFSQFGCSFHCLNFDDFRDTALLTKRSWGLITSKQFLEYFFTSAQALPCGSTPIVQSRVIGGQNAKPGAWPWQVWLKVNLYLSP